MTPTADTLGPLVEFSIGLGGFSAVVSVFLHRARSLSDLDRYRVLNLLLLALSPAFFAFLYTGLGFLLDDVLVISRVCSAVLLLNLIGFTVVTLRGQGRLPSDQRALISRGVYRFMAAATFANTAAQATAAAGLAGALAFALFYFGLVLMLLQGVIQFVRIITTRPRSDSPAMCRRFLV